jgi:hypothetical protein
VLAEAARLDVGIWNFPPSVSFCHPDFAIHLTPHFHAYPSCSRAPTLHPHVTLARYKKITLKRDLIFAKKSLYQVSPHGRKDRNDMSHQAGPSKLDPFTPSNRCPAAKASLSRFARLALLCALAFPASGHAFTDVKLSNKVTGLSNANRALNATSNGYPILQFTCETNTTGTTWFGSTYGETTTFGRAEVGRLRVSAVSQSDAAILDPSGGASCASQCTAYADWIDTFTINSSTQPLGQLGEMTVLVRITGDMTLQCSYPQSTVYFRVSVHLQDSYGANTNFAGGTETQIALNGTTQTLSMDGALVGEGLWPVRCQFHFGRPISVTAWAEVYADARSSATNVAEGTASGYSSSDFSHSVIWAGITNVNVGGVAVTNFTTTSDSGYNYLLGTITNAPVITRIQSLPQGLALDWTDLGPRSYTVETSPSLAPAAWAPAPGVGWPVHTNTALLPTPAQSPAFFRVKAQ